MPISQTEGYFENPQQRFLEESLLFPLAVNEISKKKTKRQKPTRFCRKTC